MDNSRAITQECLGRGIGLVIKMIMPSNLFTKFDADGSGALDANELCELYDQLGVKVTVEQIQELYGDKNVMFSLEMFEKLPKDK